MFDSLKRLQLQRRGLSCGKVRRKHGDNEFVIALRTSGWIKAAIFVGFYVALIALMTSKAVVGSLYSGQPVVAVAVATALAVLTVFHYFVNHPRNFNNNARTLLIFGLVVLQLAALKFSASYVETRGWDGSMFFLILPYGMAAMTLSVMIGRHLGMFATMVTSILGGLILPLGDVFPYLVISLMVGIVAVYVTGEVRRRASLLRAGVYVGLAGMGVCMLFGYVLDAAAAVGVSGEAVEWSDVGKKAVVPFAVGVFTGLILGGILPLLESAFQSTTTISWIESSDLNHPLLRRMTLEAPGTYHHSLVVASLAEAAAESIGANAIQCRVCSYFHDIGKLVKPEYCIENIVAEQGNPHDDLTPTMSALVIMAHVKDGVDLALKHRLKDEIIDVIEQHHGTSLVYYFYRKALAQKEAVEKEVEEGAVKEEDVPEVSEKSFRYPGPRPQSREAAIIMLADSAESASRTLEKPTPQRVTQLVEDIVTTRVLDGQLDECDLTLQELTAVKVSLVKTLRSMLHNRISYPKEGEKGKEKEGKAKEAKQDAGGKSETAVGNKGSKKGRPEKKVRRGGGEQKAAVTAA